MSETADIKTSRFGSSTISFCGFVVSLVSIWYLVVFVELAYITARDRGPEGKQKQNRPI